MTIIKNFTKMQELQISSHIHQDSRIGALVSLLVYAGPINMQFSMTPNQARYMAKALIEHASNLEDTE